MTADNVTWCPNIYVLSLCSSMYCRLQIPSNLLFQISIAGFQLDFAQKRSWKETEKFRREKVSHLFFLFLSRLEWEKIAMDPAPITKKSFWYIVINVSAQWYSPDLIQDLYAEAVYQLPWSRMPVLEADSSGRLYF